MAVRTFVDEVRAIRFHRVDVKRYKSVVGRTGGTVAQFKVCSADSPVRTRGRSAGH